MPPDDVVLPVDTNGMVVETWGLECLNPGYHTVITNIADGPAATWNITASPYVPQGTAYFIPAGTIITTPEITPGIVPITYTGDIIVYTGDYPNYHTAFWGAKDIAPEFSPIEDQANYFNPSEIQFDEEWI